MYICTHTEINFQDPRHTISTVVFDTPVSVNLLLSIPPLLQNVITFNTYLLYNVEEGNFSPSIFKKIFEHFVICIIRFKF